MSCDSNTAVGITLNMLTIRVHFECKEWDLSKHRNYFNQLHQFLILIVTHISRSRGNFLRGEELKNFPLERKIFINIAHILNNHEITKVSFYWIKHQKAWIPIVAKGTLGIFVLNISMKEKKYIRNLQNSRAILYWHIEVRFALWIDHFSN